MAKTYNTQAVKTALDSAKTVLVLLPQTPSLDTVAAGLSLYLSILKLQKQTSIGCSTEMTVGFNRLFGINKIKSRIGNQNLVISFNYPEDSLEKVSYDKDPQNQKFYLTIEPKAGHQPLDQSQVEYSYTGSNADLIFVIGARQLEDLGELYSQEKSLLENSEKTLVNLSSLDKNSQFGKINLYDPEASGSCEITFQVIKDLGISLEPDIATNLLTGIQEATDNLSTASSANTFEIIAELIRSGANKSHLSSPTPFSPKPPFGQPQSRQSFPQSFPVPQKPTTLPFQSQASTQPINPTTPINPISIPSQSTPPSPDWLKPKVYKSGQTS